LPGFLLSSSSCCLSSLLAGADGHCAPTDPCPRLLIFASFFQNRSMKISSCFFLKTLWWHLCVNELILSYKKRSRKIPSGGISVRKRKRKEGKRGEKHVAFVHHKRLNKSPFSHGSGPKASFRRDLFSFYPFLSLHHRREREPERRLKLTPTGVQCSS
jgi:hypothetical protein